MNATFKLAAILAVMGGLLVGCKQKQVPVKPADTAAATALVKVEWKLPGIESCRGLDVSSDRKLAVFWGMPLTGHGTEDSVWLVDLESGKVENLLAKIATSEDDGSRHRTALISPDAKYVAIALGSSIAIFDVRTGGTVFIPMPSRYDVAWGGNRLLLETMDETWKASGPIEAYDVAGRRVEQLKAKGWLVASDSAGKKLLMVINTKDPTSQPAEYQRVLVVTPDGKILQDVIPGGAICTDIPRLSRLGSFAAVWGAIEELNRAGFSIAPSGGGQPRCVDTEFAYHTEAVDENGGCLGIPDCGIDDGMLRFWTPDGKRHEIAQHALAGTILGDEIFFIQGDGKSATLRAVPVPKSSSGVASQPATRL